MMTNVGVLDAAARFALGVALLAWSYGEFGRPPAPDAVNSLVWALGLVFAITGFFRYCPIYAVLRTDSCAPFRPGNDASNGRGQHAPDASE